MTATILLVDPAPAPLRRTAELLEAAGFRVRAHREDAAALDDAAAVEPDAIVWAGAAAAEGADGAPHAYRRRFPARSTPLLVLSPSADAGSVVRALEAGADDCLPSTGPGDVLVATLRARVRARGPGAPGSAALNPAGRLSGIRLGQRLLQIQTEVTAGPARRVVTVVMLDGRTVHHRAAAVPASAGREELEGIIAAQHAALEASVRERAQARAARRAADGPRARLDRLHDEGLGRFLVGDFAGAATAWEEALRLDPTNLALSVNLAVAQRKREAAARGCEERAGAQHER